MNSKISMIIAVAASSAVLSAFSLPAYAQDDGARYAWADVIEAEPVTRIIRRPVDEEVCWEEEVYREIPERRSGAPVVLGAILGGLIGSQFGGGHGQDAMTVAGAAMGGAIAKDQQRRKYPQKFFASLEKRCGINTDWRETRQIIGWDVVYEYQGETYMARMEENPGDQVQVRVDVQPVPN